MLAAMETAIHPSLPDPAVCERARHARDARFDGHFFIAVRSTGIYCRPICPAPTARAENVTYYPTAAAAATAGYRPCLRCRPEAAPGSPAWRGTASTVTRGLRLIGEGALDNASVEELAVRLGVTPRHLARLFQTHLGASPVAVAQTRRLQFAKRLIDETTLPFATIADAAGFGSLRRFNDLILKTWQRSPRELRRLRTPNATDDAIVLRVPYRTPFDWPHWLDFLQRRAIPGVETVTRDGYARVLATPQSAGLLIIKPLSGENAAQVCVRGVPPALLFDTLHRARRLLDAEADPADIAATLMRDTRLAKSLARHPGLRLPGAWDAFELAVRAVLGQQISVAAARTLAGRLVTRFGRLLSEPFSPALTHCFPEPAVLADASLAGIGLPAKRAASLNALAAAVRDGRVDFNAAPDELGAALEALPGIGPWTAQYIVMRAQHNPDALPVGDLVLRKQLGNGQLLNVRQVQEQAETWRPWRAYGLMHVWAQANTETSMYRKKPVPPSTRA